MTSTGIHTAVHLTLYGIALSRWPREANHAETVGPPVRFSTGLAFLHTSLMQGALE